MLNGCCRMCCCSRCRCLHLFLLAKVKTWINICPPTCWLTCLLACLFVDLFDSLRHLWQWCCNKEALQMNRTQSRSCGWHSASIFSCLCADFCLYCQSSDGKIHLRYISNVLVFTDTHTTHLKCICEIVVKNCRCVVCTLSPNSAWFC